MTLQRMNTVLIVVNDLEAAKAFFIELGIELEGEMPLEGRCRHKRYKGGQV